MVGRSGAPGADTPVQIELQTTVVDEARVFCRRLFHCPVRLDPVGDPRQFGFSGDVVVLGPITVGEISFGVDVHLLLDELETAYQVLVPLSGTLRSRHAGVVVHADRSRAAVYRPVGEIELDWSGDCRALSIKVDRAALERELDATLDQRIVSPLQLGAGFALADGPGHTWAALVQLLHTELRAKDGLGAQPRMAARWRDMVISGLALTVEHPYGDEQTGPRRPRTVKRALDAMHAEPWRQFTASDLAAVAGVGVRVLQESFRQHVGISPLSYLRQLRLDGVHAELCHGDPWQASIGEVAYRWGFTHLGRFAGAYRTRFGVAPSQTLRDRR